jgi:hypothetical protein
MDINSGVALGSVFVGAALFGPIGAIIGIPLVAIVTAVVEAYGQRYELHPEVQRRTLSRRMRTPVDIILDRNDSEPESKSEAT